MPIHCRTSSNLLIHSILLYLWNSCYFNNSFIKIDLFTDLYSIHASQIQNILSHNFISMSKQIKYIRLKLWSSKSLVNCLNNHLSIQKNINLFHNVWNYNLLCNEIVSAIFAVMKKIRQDFIMVTFIIRSNSVHSVFKWRKIADWQKHQVSTSGSKKCLDLKYDKFVNRFIDIESLFFNHKCFLFECNHEKTYKSLW